VVEIWETLKFTDFPARSGAIAEEIAEHEPDLIGLQEVALWEPSGPGTVDEPIDFLAVLLEDLEDRDLSYSAVAVSENALIGPVPLLAPCNPPGPCWISY
jgi:hypothetical protein